MTAQYKEYYEPVSEIPTDKPLAGGEVVEGRKKKRFKVSRYYYGKGHCYTFRDLSEQDVLEEFAMKCSEVVKAIKEKRIKIIALPNSEIK